jgi:ParB family chromosome partitioning protein
MAIDKRKALGRGLGALIPAANTAATPATDSTDAAGGVAVHTQPVVPGSLSSKRDYFLCPIEEIGPSRDNPRQRFDEERLEELAGSIRVQGVVQPLVVRALSLEEQKAASGLRYVLIAGERRWRAAQRAGLRDVPVVVKDVSAANAFELALVENLQREDLNPMEEAEAYRRLSEEFGYTQEELARRVGKERATVANSLRLLKLPQKAPRKSSASSCRCVRPRSWYGAYTKPRTAPPPTMARRPPPLPRRRRKSQPACAMSRAACSEPSVRASS